MKKTFRNVCGLIVLGFFLMLSSCEPSGECIGDFTPYMKASFYTLNANGKPAAWKDSLVSVEELYTGQLLSNQTFLPGTIGLPLNPLKDSAAFAFHFQNSDDTLWVTYTSIDKILSPECGLQTYYNHLDTLHQSFDSLAIIHQSVRTTNETELEIYSL